METSIGTFGRASPLAAPIQAVAVMVFGSGPSELALPHGGCNHLHLVLHRAPRDVCREVAGRTRRPRERSDARRQRRREAAGKVILPEARQKEVRLVPRARSRPDDLSKAAGQFDHDFGLILAVLRGVPLVCPVACPGSHEVQPQAAATSAGSRRPACSRSCQEPLPPRSRGGAGASQETQDPQPEQGATLASQPGS